MMGKVFESTKRHRLRYDHSPRKSVYYGRSHVGLAWVLVGEFRVGNGSTSTVPLQERCNLMN